MPSPSLGGASEVLGIGAKRSKMLSVTARATFLKCFENEQMFRTRFGKLPAAESATFPRLRKLID
jgi:hypothetical protein